MNMNELEQMRRKWVEVTRKNGFREGITDLLAYQYPKKTHFIFELLQNAEDARATEVEFRVEPQQLVFSHNGDRLFSDKDVKSITSIGKSTKSSSDSTQIGEHGIGFKAVFAYTHTPRIHSGDKHFDIKDVVVPCLLSDSDKPTDLKPRETRIILPFDTDAIPKDNRFRKLVPPKTAIADISDALKKLNVRTLLFLRHIEKIRWTLLDGIKGFHSREPGSMHDLEQKSVGYRYVDVTNGDTTENWVIFEQKLDIIDDNKKKKCIVEVAFLLENGKVVPARNTELVVYFPTEKKTGLAFLIQGPFKTTKSRDNIKSDDLANQRMLKAAAQLAAESLEILRDDNLLDVSSYLALPLRELEDSFFMPVYEKIRKSLKTKPLLPAYDGIFIKAQEAKLASSKELVNLFSREQLSRLFGEKNLSWLNESITTIADLHTYLVGRKKYKWCKDWEIKPLWPELQVEPADLAPKLTASFFSSQPLAWLIKFIRYAAERGSALRHTPFIRLESGEQVSLPKNGTSQRPAWFAPKDIEGLDLSKFSIVQSKLAANDKIRNFLEKEGIREIDASAIVEKSILPKYQDSNVCFDESNYRIDLRRISEAYCKADDAAKSQLRTILDKSAWLACVHASGNAPDKLVWKKPGEASLFEKTEDHETWFKGLKDVDAYFLHTSVIEVLSDVTNDLAKTTSTLTINLSENDDMTNLSNERGNHKWGLNGFNPVATIVGLNSAWTDWNPERSKVLWKILLSTPPKIISGETQSSTNRQKLGKAPKKIEYTEVGKLCLNKAWLPDKSGKWCMPNELLLTDLPEGFESTSIAAKEVAEKLKMRQAEREQALDLIAGGNPELKRQFELFLSASDDERGKVVKMISRERRPEPAPSFKDGLKNLGRQQRGRIERSNNENFPVSNPDRYQDKLNERIKTEVKEHQSAPRKITFSPVRNNPSNAEARRFLYEEYHGRCQVTGTTFPKASRNTDGMAEYYFEACTLLSYANADYLNNAGNMLCVSADTMAKLKYASVEFLESLEDVIERFKINGKSAESVSVKIRMAGEECCIQWSQRHFMRLVALYENA